jgi:hypothetical protein
MGTSAVTTDTDDASFRDSGLTCCYDGEVIEYLDGVIVVFVVKPYLVNGQLVFHDIMTEDEDDYLYEPAFYHSKNWDEIEEQFTPYSETADPLQVEGAICQCYYCKSGILPGESTGVATFGEVLRSQRDPDCGPFGNHFENMDRDPRLICIACLHVINDEVWEIWPDGASHNDACHEGIAVRCWRDGCPGNCEKKEG